MRSLILAGFRSVSCPLAAFGVGLLVAGAVVGVPSEAEAQRIPFQEVAENGVRIDGALRDWRGIRFLRLGSGDDAALEYAFLYDARGFYLGARVRDERHVRTRRPGAREDAIIVTFAVPLGPRLRGTDVWLHAGTPGRQASSGATSAVGGSPRPARSIRVVEGPLEGGYALEAFVPWSLVGGAERWQSGRVAIRLRDVDREARPEVEQELASAEVHPARLDRLPEIEATGGADAMLRSFLRSRDLRGVRPRFDLVGNVAGDRRPERVVLVDRYVVVMGPGYRNGSAFDFFELPVIGPGDISEASLGDLTADGLGELQVKLRQSNELGSRRLWQAYRFDRERIEPALGIEIRKETSHGFVENSLRVRPARGRAPTITVTVGASRGLSEENYREAPPQGLQPILLPWGAVSARSFQWNGSRFDVTTETPNPRASNPRPPVTERRTPTRPRAPRGPSSADLLTEYRRQAGLSSSVRPRHRTQANVAEGREREQLLVFGKELVVVGDGFRGGRGFFRFELPIERPEDLISLSTHDLTGDGRQEIVLRVRRRAGTAPSGEEVVRELLLVRQFVPRGFRRLLAVEVGRTIGRGSVENQVRLRRGRLSIEPGRARGFDAASWPFADGTSDGVEPLLLPWRDSARAYRYERGRLFVGR